MKSTEIYRTLISHRSTRLMTAKITPALILLVASATLAGAQCTRCCGNCCISKPNVSVSPMTAQQRQPVVATTTLLNCLPYATVIRA